MKNKLKILFAFVLFTSIGYSQSTTDYVGHVTLLRKNGIMFYAGVGTNSPSSTTEQAGVVKGLDLNFSVYKPIWFWDKSNISLGFNAGGGYNFGNGNYDIKNQYRVYDLFGQSQSPTVTERGTGSPKNAGFRFEIGPQMNIHLGEKFTISPIFNIGYLSISQKSFAVTETLYFNGFEYDYDLLSQKETKTNGLGIIPKIRFAYNITSRFGIWLEGSYLIGPKIKTETTIFQPAEGPVENQYYLGQFEDGSYTTNVKETSYSAMGISGGIVFDFWYARSSEWLRHKNKIESSSTTEFSGSESIYDCVHCGEKISNAKEAVSHQKVCPKKSNSDTTSTSATLGYQVIDKCKKLVPMCKKDSKDVDCGECSAKVNLICAIKEVTYDCNTSTTTTKSKSVRFESNNTNVKAYSIEDNEKSNDAKLANSDAIKSYVSSLISEGYRYDYAIVNKIYNKYTLIYNFKNKDSDTELIIIPLVLEKEYLKLGEKVIIQNAKGETIKKITDISSQKHNYVGHVTLLR